MRRCSRRLWGRQLCKRPVENRDVVCWHMGGSVSGSQDSRQCLISVVQIAEQRMDATSTLMVSRCSFHFRMCCQRRGIEIDHQLPTGCSACFPRTGASVRSRHIQRPSRLPYSDASTRHVVGSDATVAAVSLEENSCSRPGGTFAPKFELGCPNSLPPRRKADQKVTTTLSAAPGVRARVSAS